MTVLLCIRQDSICLAMSCQPGHLALCVRCASVCACMYMSAYVRVFVCCVPGCLTDCIACLLHFSSAYLLVSCARFCTCGYVLILFACGCVCWHVCSCGWVGLSWFVLLVGWLPAWLVGCFGGPAEVGHDFWKCRDVRARRSSCKVFLVSEV